MKALEILKNDLEYMCKSIMSNPNWQGETTEDIEEYKIAILELEELNNRSCYECKHWCQEFQAIGICCKGIKEEKQFRESMTYSNFYCSKWELK